MKNIFWVLTLVLTGTTHVVCQTNPQVQQDDSTLIITTNWIKPSPQFRYIGNTLHNIYSPPFQCVAIPDDVINFGDINRDINGPASDISEHDIILVVRGMHNEAQMGHLTSWEYTFNNFPYFRYNWTQRRIQGGYSGPWPIAGSHLSQQAVLVKEKLTYSPDGREVTHTKREYDCGTPMTKAVCIVSTNTLGQLKKMAQLKKAKASDAKNRVLKANQDAADKGDEYGLLRMGERYRDGDGVEKDLAKAKEYLQKAADAGSPTAKDELSNLNQP